VITKPALNNKLITKGASMKKLIFAFTIMSLFAIGCNRDNQSEAVGSGAGIEREEVMETEGMESEDMQNMEEGRDDSLLGDEQREESRGGLQDSGEFQSDEYQTDDANITTPIDQRPELEEEVVE
jgi:hypothetical protein